MPHLSEGDASGGGPPDLDAIRERLGEIENELFGATMGAPPEEFDVLDAGDKIHRLKKRAGTIVSITNELMEDAPTANTEWAIFADMPLQSWKNEASDMAESLKVADPAAIDSLDMHGGRRSTRGRGADEVGIARSLAAARQGVDAVRESAGLGRGAGPPRETTMAVETGDGRIHRAGGVVRKGGKSLAERKRNDVKRRLRRYAARMADWRSVRAANRPLTVGREGVDLVAHPDTRPRPVPPWA